MAHTTNPCHHFDPANLKEDSERICQECAKTGDAWVHLRVCQTCGGVHCCDSSKNRHATKHYMATGHPVAISAEPGERWAWCYEDNTLIKY